MKYNKRYLVVLITAFSIIINLLGRYLATVLRLPVWFDSFGTILIAYIYGPICGSIVGIVNNIIYGIFVEEQSIYCFVGVMIGVVSGVLAKKGAFESPFRVMTLGGSLSLLCTCFSVPLSMILYGGSIGNIWGEQLLLMCVNNGVPRMISRIIAQFYIEFLDKLLSVYGVYLIVQLIRFAERKAEKKKMQQHLSWYCCWYFLVFALCQLMQQIKKMRQR